MYMKHLVWNVDHFLLTINSSWISTGVILATQLNTGQPLEIISHDEQQCYHIVVQDTFAGWNWIWQLTRQQETFNTVLTLLSLLVKWSMFACSRICCGMQLTTKGCILISRMNAQGFYKTWTYSTIYIIFLIMNIPQNFLSGSLVPFKVLSFGDCLLAWG